MIKAIAAIDQKRGLADEHGIPWHGKIPTDVNYVHEKFKSGGDILMGWRYYTELSKPYKGSINYVAIAGIDNPKLRPGFVPVLDARKFLQNAKGDIWNGGGAILFESTFDLLDELYITQLQSDFNCTKFFPEYKDKFQMVSESEPITENGITYTFQVWKRKDSVS